MTDLSRLYNFVDGTPAVADQVDAELDQIIARINDLPAEALQSVLVEALGLSTPGAVRRGSFFQSAAGSRTNVAYGALSNGPDVVSGLVVPAKALVRVRFKALWKESVTGAAKAAIFIGSNQLVQPSGAVAPSPQNAYMSAGGTGPDKYTQLWSAPIGLVSRTSNPTDMVEATTGQTLFSGTSVRYETAGTGVVTSDAHGGDCIIENLAPGTYDISVQYLATSGTVTVKDRRLYVDVVAY